MKKSYHFGVTSTEAVTIRFTSKNPTVFEDFSTVYIILYMWLKVNINTEKTLVNSRFFWIFESDGNGGLTRLF